MSKVIRPQSLQLKIQELKSLVFEITGYLTKKIKKLHSDLDLRTRKSWEYLVSFYNKKVEELDEFTSRRLAKVDPFEFVQNSYQELHDKLEQSKLEFSKEIKESSAKLLEEFLNG